MIHDVDESLRALVRRDVLDGIEVDVVFDAPTKDWSNRRNAPTIDLYLYDIREDLRRRQVGRSDHREHGVVTSRHEPPRWYKLSYLVTAWTQRPEDEHRLLASVLRCFLAGDRLPSEVLAGSLSGIRCAIPYSCALPPPQDRALSDVWSALGGELKPSLDLVVIAPFDLSRPIEVGPPVLEDPKIVLRAGGDTDVADAAEGKTGPGRVGRRTVRTRPPGAVASEERLAGAAGQPGRVVRIKELPR